MCSWRRLWILRRARTAPTRAPRLRTYTSPCCCCCAASCCAPPSPILSLQTRDLRCMLCDTPLYARHSFDALLCHYTSAPGWRQLSSSCDIDGSGNCATGAALPAMLCLVPLAACAHASRFQCGVAISIYFRPLSVSIQGPSCLLLPTFDVVMAAMMPVSVSSCVGCCFCRESLGVQCARRRQ